MSLPSFASFPQATLRRAILPEEWEACLDAWLLLAQRYLLLTPKVFSLQSDKNDSLVEFLVSYVREDASADDLARKTTKEKELRRTCFLLGHRLLTEVVPSPPELLSLSFLGDFSTVYARSKSLHILLEQTWLRQRLETNPGLQEYKSNIIKHLEQLQTKTSPIFEQDLRRTAALLKACHAFGHFLMTGSDFLDSLATVDFQPSTEYAKQLVVVAYLALTSLMEGAKPNVSLLLDHLYSLKSSWDSQAKFDTPQIPLLASIVSSTHLLQKLRDRITGPDAARAKSLISSLEGLGGGPKLKRPTRRRVNKGKHIYRDEYGHGALGEVHVHKMSLITQIQDLFPDLGSGFIVKLLDEYGDDVEQVTAHLLDDSLPAHLKQADRSESMGHANYDQSNDLVPHLAPRTTPPLLPSRRNVFDNDDFDKLAIDTSRLHIGRKDENMTADNILSDRSNAPNKAAILSALAAFDSDDDERDDTYDAEDVGGTVDTALPGSDESDLRDKNEESLFSAYQMSPGVFERDANTRRGKARAALKSETGMTHEAIEGWAIMIDRDPRRLRRLEAKFSTFSGAQRELAPTAYRESPAGSGAEDSDGGGRGRRGGFRGRGRGRGGGGTGGGPVDEKLARQRKDAQKGSRANHNRRDQRARKMARGGFAG